MSVTETPSACPACSVAPMAGGMAARDIGEGNIILSLPGIHCAGCIAGVERGLASVPGLRAARVNLSRKRVTIDAEDGISPDVLISRLADLGFEAHELDTGMLAGSDRRGRDLLTRLAVAGFAMMNVMLFSVAVWSGASDSTRSLFHLISAAIAVPTILYSAQPFFQAAWSALKVRRLNMDVPISLAIILAGAMSVSETLRHGDQVYFDAALSLTFFLLIGRYLDHRTRIAARSAAQELSALEVPRAQRIIGKRIETVDVAALQVGDQIRVAAGMRVPVDGIMTGGASDMDRSFLTGESLPVAVHSGTPVAAGEVNLTGPVILRVTAVGEDTSLRKMAALVEIAEGARNRYTALADRAARIYAPAVHLLALFAFIGWIIGSGDVIRSLNIAISVLIITCPCALGLAVPAVMTAASGRLFRRGLLVKNGTALERLAEIDTVVFDKTGTLTEGHIRLNANDLPETERRVLAALSRASLHPVSRAIATTLGDVDSASLSAIGEIPGCGVEAEWNGQTVRLGRADWVGGTSSPALRIGDGKVHHIAFEETLRDGAKETIKALQEAGLDVAMFTGDRPDAAQRLAAKLGINEAPADMLPADKLEEIEARQRAGRKVLMIGDGLNDTAALAAAHASISPASALDASRTVSDIVLLGTSLREIPEAIRTARNAHARVQENFSIATLYNLIAVPIALAGFATPLAAALAMSISSITVLLNALRVR